MFCCSCDLNLKIYCVYVEIMYKWFLYIGMYVMCDIEFGEEFLYDYNYGLYELYDGYNFYVVGKL